MKLVECVPNISEGRDRSKIDAITGVVADVASCWLLDVDPGADTNRTVITFVGTPEGVAEAAFRLIQEAYQRLDMRSHTGAHARMGAVDVCPFVPVSDVTMAECVAISKSVGERVGKELGLPVYLYESSATRPERQNLATIRKGEYEGLSAKLNDPEWQPDYGEGVFNPKFGAVAIGAREFLIAYNININSRDRRVAHEIALNIREAGRAKRDTNGEIIRDDSGRAIKVPGKLKCVKGVGWYIDTYRMAQVSVNLTNYKVTPLYTLFETVCQEAEKLGVRVTGGELVGLIPKQALLECGTYFLKKQKRPVGLPERDLLSVAVQSLGLSELAPFDINRKVVEYSIPMPPRPLQSASVAQFVDELSSESPAPGGGSVAALAGGCAAALTAMVANLSLGKPIVGSVVKSGEESKQYEMVNRIAESAQSLKAQCVWAIDEDTFAFNAVMSAMRQKAKSDDEKAAKTDRIMAANKAATRVPFSVLEIAEKIVDLASSMVEWGNPNALSDAGVSAQMALASGRSAFYNVLINCQSISDSAFVQKAHTDARSILDRLVKKADAIHAILLTRLGDRSGDQ